MLIVLVTFPDTPVQFTGRVFNAMLRILLGFCD
jgi:hypothetical protein